MASHSGWDLLALPRLWRGGIRGLQVGVSVSVVELGTAAQGGGCTRGMWAHCTAAGFAPGVGHWAGVTVLARGWTGHMQGGIQKSRGQGWPPGRSGSDHCQWLLQLHRDVFRAHACARVLLVAVSCLEKPQ